MKNFRILLTAAMLACAPSLFAAPKLNGTVIESFESGGYTYFRFDSEGQEYWAATSPTELQPGQTVEVSSGLEMKNFHSPTLDRTFDSIYFTGAVLPGGQAAPAELPEGHPSIPGMEPSGSMGMPSGHPDISGMGGHGEAHAASFMLEGTVKTAEVVPNYTYLELEDAEGALHWAAVSTRDAIEPGARIGILQAVPMEQFHSAALERDFEKILFVSEFEILR